MAQKQQLPSYYQQFIHLSRYSRFLPELGRRETWEETVDRFITFMCDYQCKDKIDEVTRERLRDAILHCEVMPSMRALMTAGAALRRDNMCAFNCSYCAVDNVLVFSEILYILMCGTGVGFSCEQQYVQQLPEVPSSIQFKDIKVVVRDSKIGWSEAFHTLLGHLYQGAIPEINYSKIRPSGARLKTMGGRASGPAPLRKLFDYTVHLFRKRSVEGGRLSSVEVHNLVCQIAEIVVVGGVRRSALLSLSNLDDNKMRHAKSGQWWMISPWLSMANNSVAYTERPDIETFMEEMLSLIKSKSGERGIFNRKAATKQARANGRRDYKYDWGTNPCVPADSWVMTDRGPRQVKDLIGHHDYQIVVNGKPYPVESEGFFETGTKTVYEVTLKCGLKVRTSDNHPFLIRNGEWKQLKTLSLGEEIQISNHETAVTWPGFGNFDEGWLVGEVVGDGCIVRARPSRPNRSTSAYVCFWGESRYQMTDLAVKLIKAHCKVRNNFTGNHGKRDSQAKAVDLYRICQAAGITETKEVTEKIHITSSDFQRGFLRGLFDADGTVGAPKGHCNRIMLTQSNLPLMEIVQKMLLRFGIASRIYLKKEAQWHLFPDRKGGKKDYWCKAAYDLRITKNNMIRYQQLIGFHEPAKAQRLAALLASYSPHKEKFLDKIIDIHAISEQPVYDVTVTEVHEFDCEGFRLSNCSEILLRSKQCCNLSEVVVREDDTLISLTKKVELATILGTMQATLTNFRYVSEKWRENCEEEALLGVSFTGIYDNPFMARPSSALKRQLSQLRQTAIDVNQKWAARLGINASTAITCVKPSGTVSQLVDCASGIHPNYAPFFIRRVRIDKKDPLYRFMADRGIPVEDEIHRPDSTAVFSFPRRSPPSAICRNDPECSGALNQLTLWKLYQEFLCEHKPSITTYVKPGEWPAVIHWVWDNFDDISGIAFLPYDGGTYQQAPYEEISKEQYDELCQRMPKEIDWSELSQYEQGEDNTQHHGTLACTGNVCEQVDLIDGEPEAIFNSNHSE